MTTQESTNLSTMSTKAMASIDAYHLTRKEAARRHAIENVASLSRALEKPADAIFKLFLSPTVLMAIKIANDLNIFTLLSHATPFVTNVQLSASKDTDILLIERIMRVLVCNGFASERGPGQYEPADLFINFLLIMCKTPEFFRKTSYRNPGDPKNGPLQHAYNTSGSCWDWLAENPDALDRFNTFMEGHRTDIAHWVDWFPVQEQLLEGAIANRPLIVDVGGGRGHDLVGFKERFPLAVGKLVLEDLPSVIEDIQDLDDDIQKVKHDFFKPQPVKGARAYYFKHIMYDWPDENCRIILHHTAAAMERGYSKVLIEEHIVPDQNAGPQETLLDMTVMVWCSGRERTRRRWTELLDSVGLVIKNVWLPDGHTNGIIEAELQVPPESSPYSVTAN
ncbi:S-adenosyl-L-methionine-dependent methyltransferase [Aspergillus lucknowensis]|uniref:S-adenosyl-L-methionine-dependent methyltransferase n=1 Tax=Aspergillus lucknowensis TaxID=176173 RepID=A0ABR4M0P6_9EURO